MEDLQNVLETIITLAQPFFDEGSDHVVVARHCERLYVGTGTPAKCGVCGSEDLSIVYAVPGDDGITLSGSKPA